MIECSFVLIAAELSAADVSDINALGQQLSPRFCAVTIDDLRTVLRKSHIVLARDTDFERDGGSRVVGIAVLTPHRTVSNHSGIVDDVVVDAEYRGRGIAKGLMRALETEARRIGLKFLDLTSAPSRVAANLLYQSLGYTQRETNVYRLPIA